MKSPRQTTRKVNTQKIKELFKNSGKSYDDLADAIGGVSSRTLRRMAEEKDIRVSKSALDVVKKHFNVNINELYIPDDEKVISNHVFLEEIQSLSNLFENQTYTDLRSHNGDKNIRTFRKYDVSIDGLTKKPIQELIQLSLSKSSLLHSYGNEESDIEKEMEYINKLKEGNDALEYLRSRGVYLYYGNYKFKGIQDIFLDRDKLKPASKKDKEIFKELVGEIDNKEELTVYEGGTAKLTPIEIKIEIFYFKEFFNNYSIPSRYKIYPNLGYTEKQLIDDYISALKKNKFEEQEIESVKEWLKNISYLNWYIKERVENSSNLISLGNYLPSNFYLDMSSENLNYFKFFESDAKSYNGNFEEVFEYPHIRKLEWNGSRYFENTVVQESEDIDKIFQNKKEEPMK